MKRKALFDSEDGWSPPYLLIFLYMLAALASLIFRPTDSEPRAGDVECVRNLLGAIQSGTPPGGVCPRIEAGYSSYSSETETWTGCPDPWEHLPFGPRFYLSGQDRIVLNLPLPETSNGRNTLGDRSWRIEIVERDTDTLIKSGPRGYLRLFAGPALALIGTMFAIFFFFLAVAMLRGPETEQDSKGEEKGPAGNRAEDIFLAVVFLLGLGLAAGSAWQGARMALGDREIVIAGDGEIFVRPAPFLGFERAKPHGTGKAVAALPLRSGKGYGLTVFTVRKETIWLKIPQGGEAIISSLIGKLNPSIPVEFAQ